MSEIEARIGALDWDGLNADLDGQGFAVVPDLLRMDECDGVKALYENEALFRKKVVMARHDYGRGEYQYFAYPLPSLVERMRTEFFRHLALVANRWCGMLGQAPKFPDRLREFLAQCHGAGQVRPTPLILKYGEGDFNRLHRDLYGEWQFPLQVVFLLDEPGKDFEGGELVLVEQKPRSQSKAEVIPMRKGTAVIFAVSECPRMGVRGYRKLKLSHGVSRIRAGSRHTLGLIFHDAQ